MTSSAMACETVWMEAPCSSARLMRPGYRLDVGLQSSGNRTGVRSCTVTSRAAFGEGGTTKLVPWTTSTDRSIAPPWDGRTVPTPGATLLPGSGLVALVSPNWAAVPEAICPAVMLRPYPMTPTWGSVATAAMNPATDSPTPVRTPRSGVASTATVTEPAGLGMCRTIESARLRPVPRGSRASSRPHWQFRQRPKIEKWCGSMANPNCVLGPLGQARRTARRAP